MRSGVIWSSAVRSDTCEVTRDIHRLSSTFISPKKPWCRVRCANIWCSSLKLQPPACSAALLSGAKVMPSMRPSSARSIMSRKRLAADAPRFRRHRAARHAGRVEVAQVDDRDFGSRPVDVLGCRIAAPRHTRRRHRARPAPARAHRRRPAGARRPRGAGRRARARIARDRCRCSRRASGPAQAGSQASVPVMSSLRSVKWLISSDHHEGDHAAW